MPNVPRSQPTRRLPPAPSLEQLRKQAKDLLRQYRAADPSAVAEVQRFEHRPDPAAFALHDAQRVLARAYGYPSWPKLAAFVNGANVQELAAAVEASDQPRVRALLEARPELVSMDMSANNEHRALHFAVLRRDAGMVRLLMQAGADARQGIYPHRDATTAYALARDREYGEIVAAIEEEERRRVAAPPEQRDPEGATPLHLAAEESDREKLSALLLQGANPRDRDLRGYTALDRAALAADPRNHAAREFPAVAQLLLDHGAELTLRAAVALGDAPRVRQLLAADPAALREVHPGGGLVTLAVKHGQIEMVRLLLDLGADVDERMIFETLEEATSSWGMPLWYAALANQREIVELLLDRGADPNANVYASGWPLRNAWNHPDGLVKQMLLDRGARRQPYMVAEQHDVAEARRLLDADPSEELAREFAWSGCDHGCPAIVRLALPRLPWPPGDPRWHWVIIQPIRGATADRADRSGHFESMEALLEHGVDPNVARYGQTALHFAAAYRGNVADEDRARFAAMLLEAGARLDRRDDLLQSTPLAWACRWGRVKLAQELLARGAPIEEPDAQPWGTPQAWAAKMGRPEILALLSCG